MFAWLNGSACLFVPARVSAGRPAAVVWCGVPWCAELCDVLSCAMLCVHLSVCLSVCLYVCLSVGLSIVCLPVYLFICLSGRLSVCLSVRLLVCQPVCLSVCLFVGFCMCAWLYDCVCACVRACLWGRVGWPVRASSCMHRACKFGGLSRCRSTDALANRGPYRPTVWCGVLCCRVLPCVVVWCALVCCDVLRRGVVRCAVIWFLALDCAALQNVARCVSCCLCLCARVRLCARVALIARARVLRAALISARMRAMIKILAIFGYDSATIFRQEK